VQEAGVNTTGINRAWQGDIGRHPTEGHIWRFVGAYRLVIWNFFPVYRWNVEEDLGLDDEGSPRYGEVLAHGKCQWLRGAQDSAMRAARRLVKESIGERV
jgi:hypothetical protein